MLNVQSLTVFLKSLGPERNVQRFSFYNFLTQYSNPAEIVSDELLFNYFNHIYNYAHWRDNQQDLLIEISSLLDRYFRSMHSENPINVKGRFHWQLISMQDMQQFSKAIENYLNDSNDASNVKILSNSQHKVLSLSVPETGAIELTEYRNVFKIVGGRLYPLEPITNLKYTDELELVSRVKQFINLNEHTQAILTFSPELAGTGQLVRGYSLQKYSSLQFKQLSDYPDIHQIIKRLENHFISPKSDPEYIDLITWIEKSTQMLIQNEPGSEKIALSTYQKGQYAAENLFPNDKYLKLLLSQLELAIFKRGRETLNV